MIIAILSDIHGNISALKAVHRDFLNNFKIESLALLGDVIDYGQHSNEVIQYLKEIKGASGENIPLLCNIFGNHECAICGDVNDSRFSSDRTRTCAAHTKEHLTEESWEYIKDEMNPNGWETFFIGEKKILVVHGSLEDYCWKSITPSMSNDVQKYENYDVVLSGHSHIPHYFEGYVKTDNPQLRNKKRVVFINPGSVGQPRNQCPLAQYVVYDTVSEQCCFRKIAYDVAYEMNAFDDNVDSFYKERLALGI